MEAPVPSSGLYTCLACQVAFESAEGQRIHYRSDWHRYNLKRKVADLPPVSLEQFQQKQKGSITYMWAMYEVCLFLSCYSCQRS